MNSRRTAYLRVLTLWCLALSAVVVAFNLVIDPYGYFRLVTLPGINEKKPRPDIDMVAVKTAGVRAIKPDALILGNSRAEIGFDPEHPGFHKRGLTAYNFSIPGGDLQTVWRQLQNDGAPLTPKVIVLGLDFQDFLVDPNAPGADYTEPAPRSAWVSLRNRFQALYTVAALVDSVTTVLIQSQPYAATLTARGFNPLRDYLAIARIDGWHTLFQHKAEAVARSLVTLPTAIVAPGTDSSPPLQLARTIVRTSLAQGTELHLVIYPYHAQLLMLYDAAGLWPAFEDWKRRLVALLAAEAPAGAAGGTVTLWDFSGFHRYALEPVPTKDDRKAELHWYWEAAHFRKELGDIMLERMFDGAIAEEAFGLRLAADNIELELDRMRRGRELVRSVYPALVTQAEGLMNSARATRSRDNNRPLAIIKQ